MKSSAGSLVVLASLGLSLSAHAASFTGTAAFSDTSSNNNSYSLIGTFDQSPFSFTGTTGFIYTDQLTITVVDADCHGNCGSDHDNISLTLNFSAPNNASTSFGGTGDVSFHGIWNGTEVNWTSNTRTVAFNDGSSLLITLPDFTFSDWSWDTLSGSENLTMKVVSAPTATPEPSSLALLGTGILGAAGLIRRKFSF